MTMKKKISFIALIAGLLAIAAFFAYALLINRKTEKPGNDSSELGAKDVQNIYATTTIKAEENKEFKKTKDKGPGCDLEKSVDLLVRPIIGRLYAGSKIVQRGVCTEGKLADTLYIAALRFEPRTAVDFYRGLLAAGLKPKDDPHYSAAQQLIEMAAEGNLGGKTYVLQARMQTKDQIIKLSIE